MRDNKLFDYTTCADCARLEDSSHVCKHVAPVICRYCRKQNHMAWFCPSKPNENMVAEEKSSSFINRLLDSPQVNITELLKGLSPRQAIAALEAKGEEWNRGNPWLHSNQRRDAVRKRLGFWKALGCKRNVLTWIARGVPYRPQRTPPQHAFRNQRSYIDNIEFVHSEIRTHLQDGSFKIVERDEAIIINPLQVVTNDRGKHRMCVDLPATSQRYSNAETN